MSASHRICVMGRELQVRSAASSETVREVEAIVNAKLAEVAAAVQVSDTQLVAILALMNIAEAYLTVQKERDLLQSQGEATVRRLLGRIEQDFS